VLSDARPLSAPVPYRHPNGAVTWVVLGRSITQAIDHQLRTQSTPELPTTPAVFSDSTGTAPVHSSNGSNPTAPKQGPSAAAESRIVSLTGGNIRHGHIYVPLDFFPTDAIGGANKHEAAPRSLCVSFVPGQTTETDIDGTKRILRVRGAVRDFLVRSGLNEGDVILIERTASYAYRFSKA
jgi:hypothetical protein